MKKPDLSTREQTDEVSKMNINLGSFAFLADEPEIYSIADLCKKYTKASKPFNCYDKNERKTLYL
jgi:hypothetical protein